ISEVINNSPRLSRNDSQSEPLAGENGITAGHLREMLSELAFLPASDSSQKQGFHPYSFPTTRMSNPGLHAGRQKLRTTDWAVFPAGSNRARILPWNARPFFARFSWL